MKSSNKVEFGDFQTPPALAREVCELVQRLGENPDVVMEPTAGRGAFLVAAAETFSRAALRGWDINADYVQEATGAINAIGALRRTAIACQDFFSCDWESELAALNGNLLLLGNPPWVTNSGVAVVNGTNLPAKENFLGLRGIAARTGKSNFDISEWMLIRLLRALHGRTATLAMLCKTATARKFLRYAWQNDGRIRDPRSCALRRRGRGRRCRRASSRRRRRARTGRWRRRASRPRTARRDTPRRKPRKPRRVPAPWRVR